MKKSMTLIELLAVIGIILILISILMPVLSNARETSKHIKCQSQLRETARSFHYYFAEHKDIFPTTDYGNRSLIEYPSWFNTLEKYLFIGNSELDHEQYGLMKCPTLPAEAWNYDAKTLGYGYNRYWLGWNVNAVIPDNENKPKPWRSIHSVKSPSDCLMIGDSLSTRLAEHPDSEQVSGHVLDWEWIAKFGYGVETRHKSKNRNIRYEYKDDAFDFYDGVGNIGWVDGHVSSKISLQINDIDKFMNHWK